eukprot:2622890-Ditylum_brightwellii.AAC.1
MNLHGYTKAKGIALSCLETSLKFLNTGLANHSAFVGIYVSFLVANSEIGKAYMVTTEVKKLKDEIKNVTAKIKAAKSQASSSTTK